MRDQKSLVLLVFVLVGVTLSAALFGATLPVAGQADDGRLNCDEAAPVVLYCDGQGLDVYWIGPGSAIDLVLEVPGAELDIDQPETATRIAGTASGLVDVYVLATGEIQVNAYNGAEMWVGRWQDCPGGPAEVEVYSLLTGELLSREKDTCSLPVVRQVVPPTLAPTPEPTATQVPMCQAYASSFDPTVVTVPCDEVCEDFNGRNVVCSSIEG